MTGADDAPPVVNGWRPSARDGRRRSLAISSSGSVDRGSVVLEERPARPLVGSFGQNDQRLAGESVVHASVAVLVPDALAHLEDQPLGLDRHEATVEQSVEV